MKESYDNLEQYRQVDSTFVRIFSKLSGSKKLETPTQIRIFGLKCIVLAFCLLPLAYFAIWLGDMLGVKEAGNSPISYLIFFLIIPAPYSFFVGIDFLLTGQIEKKNALASAGCFRMLAVLFFLIALITSLMYYDYYSRVYSPEIKSETQLLKSFGSETTEQEVRAKRRSLDPEKETDAFFKMVAKDKQEQERSMQRAPWISGGLWLLSLIFYLLYLAAVFPQKRKSSVSAY